MSGITTEPDFVFNISGAGCLDLNLWCHRNGFRASDFRIETDDTTLKLFRVPRIGSEPIDRDWLLTLPGWDAIGTSGACINLESSKCICLVWTNKTGLYLNAEGRGREDSVYTLDLSHIGTRSELRQLVAFLKPITA